MTTEQMERIEVKLTTTKDRQNVIVPVDQFKYLLDRLADSTPVNAAGVVVKETYEHDIACSAKSKYGFEKQCEAWLESLSLLQTQEVFDVEVETKTYFPLSVTDFTGILMGFEEYEWYEGSEKELMCPACGCTLRAEHSEDSVCVMRNMRILLDRIKRVLGIRNSISR